ncbi:MAG: adenosylmethionine--8-amino-7-oxononanoate transaminase [Alphaproteobacteria bacterium]
MTTSQTDKTYIWHPYTQHQTAAEATSIVKGDGIKLFTEDGAEIWDMISSWWVNLHGHAHPKIAKAIGDQAMELEHVIFADFTHKPAARLSKRLVDLMPAPLNRVFFSDNGSTSVEVGLKMALKYWHNKGETKRLRFLSFEGGYHGDTFGAMSVGKWGDLFNPYLAAIHSQVDLIPFPETWIGDTDVEQREADALAKLDTFITEYQDEYAALIVEPLMQGAAGMRFCRPEFLQKMQARLAAANILTIYDEVSTGFGRTGKMFAFETAGTVPDIICLSKGITGGFMPLAATICHEKIFAEFLGDSFDKAFTHGHSYTANLLGCAAANASLDVFEEEKTLEKITEIASWHQENLKRFINHPALETVRTLGVISAMNLKASDAGYMSAKGAKIKAFCLEKGILVRPLGNCIYLLPPYCVTRAQLDTTYDVLFEALDL